MKKMFFLAAVAALALSSCSSDELVQAEQPVEDGAVVFSAYAGRTTRDVSTNPILEVAGLANAGGFGVFAYDQGTKNYTTYSSSSSYPNFMYNQNVWGCKSGNDTKFTNFATSEEPDHWAYDPIKYFNNNEGAKHSFFAYAPYNKAVKSVFTLGNAPQIRYSAAAENYDLLWAPAIMNIEKPGVTHKLDFNFQHALAKVDIYVAPFVDDVHGAGHSSTADKNKLDANTEIKVRGVKFVGTVASQGLLNLENGKWTFEATEESAYEINKEISLTGDKFWTATDKYEEVKKDMMVIPTLSGKPVQIQIVYDVITTDGANSVNSSTITNTITSVEKFNFIQGNAYKFYLDLGMTSVQFKAEVDEWGATTNNNVDMPNNNHWHPYPYVNAGTDPVTVATLRKQDTEPTEHTPSDYWYNTSTGVLMVGNGSDYEAVTASKSYIKDQEIYTVGADAAKACSVAKPMAYLTGTAYKYWNSTAWADVTTPGTIYSLNVNSAGQIQTGEDASVAGSWTNPENNKFYTYTVGGITYLYKWSTDEE